MNMPVTAVICELNPLHNGHLHVINKAKEAASSPVVLVMSGNFTQRGEAAAFHKYARARAAVEAGADLCVELPFPYSSAGAEDFARAGVYIAEKMGAERLVFGSESGDIGYLRRVADALSSDRYAELFSELSQSDPAAGAAVCRERALAILLPDYKKGSAPNDTLAAEYVRNASCECVPVKRIDTLSASTLRCFEADDCAPHVPEPCMRMMKKNKRADSDLFRDILWKNLRLFTGDLSGVAECGGGLGERMRKISRESTDGEVFFDSCRTKKYTDARILRAALYAATGVTRRDISDFPAYTLLLAANERGCAVLSELSAAEDFSVITKPADYVKLTERVQRQFALSAKADELYTLLIGEKAGYFMRQSPYINK